jgi:hypothetical protein
MQDSKSTSDLSLPIRAGFNAPGSVAIHIPGMPSSTEEKAYAVGKAGLNDRLSEVELGSINAAILKAWKVPNSKAYAVINTLLLWFCLNGASDNHVYQGMYIEVDSVRYNLGDIAVYLTKPRKWCRSLEKHVLHFLFSEDFDLERQVELQTRLNCSSSFPAAVASIDFFSSGLIEAVFGPEIAAEVASNKHLKIANSNLSNSYPSLSRKDEIANNVRQVVNNKSSTAVGTGWS